MAVQAQYPSNFLLLNRSEEESKEMESSSPAPAATGFLAPPAAAFLVDGASGNVRRRVREAAGAPVPATASPPPQQQPRPGSFISLQPQLRSPGLVTLWQRSMMHCPPAVSTGLGLASEDKQHGGRGRAREQSNLLVSYPSSPSTLSGELAAQTNRQRNEIEEFLLAQGEQLRHALTERRRAHYRTLLSAAQESAARRLREKEAEAERASRRRSELEDRLARLRAESMAWQAKSTADQSTVAALHAQLQQAAAAAAPSGAGDACCEPLPPAEDAGSACVDPRRAERERERATCRACRWRRASVVLLPCRHLALCDTCDAVAGSCPVCRCGRTGGVQVFFC